MPAGSRRPPALDVSRERTMDAREDFHIAPGAQSPDQENAKARPTSINQSLTVVLQSGKPMVVSQAADPVNDRKVVVEVKATVLK